MIDPVRVSPEGLLLATVRHGLTELNRDRRVGGRVDVPLIEEGREQAREARAAFECRKFDVVISSPLSRALETAEIISGVDRGEMVIDEGCTERSFGDMEGVEAFRIGERLPQVRYTEIEGIRYSLNPPSGESFEQVHRRARSFLARLLKEHAGRRVVLFAHENILQQIHGAIRGLGPMESLERGILNCELNEFHLGGDGHLLSHARTELCPAAAKHPSF